MVLVAWFSSERGRPRTRSTLVQVEPLRVSRETTPELVSGFRMPPVVPAPMRGSLEVA